MELIFVYTAMFILLLLAELAYFRIADRFNIIDKPNERSSHTSVVLRGGGIIYMIGVWMYAAFFGTEAWAFLAGLTMIAGISFVDDIRSLPDSVRLVFQFAAMTLMMYQWDILHVEDWWMVAAGLILCVGITNAYNFMDGINGINGGYGMAVLLPLLWLNRDDAFVDNRLIAVTILANFVFLLFNFRPKGKARCFAGDVGSVGMAFIIIYITGALILKTGDITYLILLAVYGVDVVLTICHRIMLHEHLGEAHRKHAYQLMANELKTGHLKVTGLYMLLQLLISAGFIMIPDTAAAHWAYAVAVVAALGTAYIVFMKRYYHLHEEYLQRLTSGSNNIRQQ